MSTCANRSTPTKTEPIVVIDDAGGNRFRLYPNGRATMFEPCEYADLEAICSAPASARDAREIVVEDDGTVELLRIVECPECDGDGHVAILRPARYSDTSPDDCIVGRKPCRDCGGHGRRFDSYHPRRYAPLAEAFPVVAGEAAA